ncbi:MAG TPA: lipid biosynthesis B12-binding/radical SAM protein [Spirochaetota bacterium]|nr:lipid biosynthesis B12-binding/radical SAM protein [Spirochaetota bacterium]
MKVLMLALNREKFPDPVFPLGASYIAGALSKAGHIVDVFDACFLENPQIELENFLKGKSYDSIGVSIRNVDNNSFSIAENYLNYYKSMVDICRKYSKAPITLGGSGFSIFPELYMKELGADYGIKGEGEYAFLELLKKIETGDPPAEKLFYSETIKDINFDTFPDRKGFDIDKYYKYSGCINIQTKRGCAYNCSYCTYPVLEGRSYRFRSAKNVVDEIEFWNKSKGIDYIFFVDNVFNHPENYALEICNEIIRRKLKIKWTGFFTPTLSDNEFIGKCLESGLTSADFGTDAFSPETLKGYNKSFTVEDIFRSCEICKERGIKFNHSLIFGGPNETMDTLKETLANVELTAPTSVIGFIGVRLYAGTQIAETFKDLDIGITPVFYISEAVRDEILDYLAEYVKDKRNWIIPGLEKGTNLSLINRIRNKGVKGPLWELLVNLK